MISYVRGCVYIASKVEVKMWTKIIDVSNGRPLKVKKNLNIKNELALLTTCTSTRMNFGGRVTGN